MLFDAVPGPTTNSASASESPEILRFRKSERHLHWALAIPFLVCWVTAMVLVLVYNPNPSRPYREAVSWVHRLSGSALAVMPLLMLVRHPGDIKVHLRNVQEGWGWRLNDVKWLLLMGPATLSKKVQLPDQGKFNAAEKINFVVLMATWPMYVTTGLMLWMPGISFVAWLVHFSMATLATPLILGHMFMATINPDTRIGLPGMISGFVNREWARHHYRLWYDEHFGSAPEPEVPAFEPALVYDHVLASSEVLAAIDVDAVRDVAAAVLETRLASEGLEAVPVFAVEPQARGWGTRRFEADVAQAVDGRWVDLMARGPMDA